MACLPLSVRYCGQTVWSRNEKMTYNDDCQQAEKNPSKVRSVFFVAIYLSFSSQLAEETPTADLTGVDMTVTKT